MVLAPHAQCILAARLGQTPAEPVLSGTDLLDDAVARGGCLGDWATGRLGPRPLLLFLRHGRNAKAAPEFRAVHRNPPGAMERQRDPAKIVKR
jgi:hypothetical protein